LGIEQAQLDPNPPSDPNAMCGNWTAANPQTDCTSCDEACVKQCDIGSCLTDQECRSGLFDYLKCVGTGCFDAGAECAGCISASPKAITAAQCLRHCGNGCDIAGSISLCEGYCACMHQQCDKNEPDATGKGCMRACLGGLPAGTPLAIDDAEARKTWDGAPAPWQIGCFWYHCESAQHPNDAFHCDHAIGHGALCTKPPAEDPNATLCPYPKRYGNAPCNVNSDCCSGMCLDSGVCSTPGG
jgi:hypothetical protein